MPNPGFTSAEFHNLVHKQITHAVIETMSGAKLDWELVLPLLEAAREMCRADLKTAGEVRVHTLRAEGDEWIDAEEAFLGLRIADRDTGEEWLSETWWLSEIMLADGDPEQVQRIVAALERSIAKVNAWLATQKEEGPAR